MRSRPMPTPAAKTYTGESIAPPSVWSKQLLGGLALAGAIQGPLLDGIHGTVHLLEYKVIIQIWTIFSCSHQVCHQSSI